MADHIDLTDVTTRDRTPIENPWELFQTVSPFARRFALFSETPGTGKTTAGMMLAEARQSDCIVITVTDSTTASDLLGHYMPQGSKFVWHDGPVTKAIRQGNTVVVFNEFPNGGPDVCHVGYALLEEGKAAQFTLPSNEVLTIPDTLSVVLTMNPNPKDCLPAAILDRLEVTLDVDGFVSPSILDALYNPATGIGTEALRSMVADGRMSAREAFTLRRMVGKGCPVFAAVQAVLGRERATDYGDALSIALSA